MKLSLSNTRIGFASAHFIIGHNKCGKLHGHNYFLNVEVEGEVPEEDDYLIDFSELKEIVMKIVDPLDHKVLIPEKAAHLTVTKDRPEHIRCTLHGDERKTYLFPEEDVIFLPIRAISAEFLSEYLVKELQEKLPEYKLTITVFETPSSSATSTSSDIRRR